MTWFLLLLLLFVDEKTKATDAADINQMMIGGGVRRFSK